MALVATDSAARACIPKSSPAKPYVLAFSKGQFYVPASSVISYPKRPNKMADGVKLGELLFTKAPSSWSPYCDPDTLMHIKGHDGSTCVYTTFAVEGHENEQRFLRFISGSIAAKNFPEWKKTIEEEVASGKRSKPSNERQEVRLAVLDWEKEKHCPNKAQLNPEMNGWTPLGKDGAEDLLKSCRVDPETKRRVKGEGGKRSREDASADQCSEITWQKTIRVGPKGSYVVNEMDGFLHIAQFSTQESSANDADADGDAS